MSNGTGNRETWGTRFGVILAVMGSAVGLGNFLRFPGLAAQYEGGAFMIPYFLALLLLGLPIALAEWTMGRYGGARGFNSPPGIFRAVSRHPLAPYVGALSAVVPVLIYMYYIHLEAWCLGYAWKYATGQMAVEPTDGYGSVLASFAGMEADGALITNPWSSALIFILISFVINFVLIYRGVNRGIEWFCKIAMPALALCALILLIRVLTLPASPDDPQQSVLSGLGFMWNPYTTERSIWQQLSNAQMWIDATGQIFFTLSVGFGLIVTYASYVKRDDDIALSAVTSAAGNQFTEVVLAGMTIIPAAFYFLGAAAVKDIGEQGSSLGLGFAALPGVFLQMPGGQFFGFLFFFLLFLAAITSSLSMLQPTIAMLEEGLGLNRRASVSLLGFIAAVGAGMIGYFSKSVAVLDTIDFWIGSFGLYVLATIMVVMFGWVLGIDRGESELNRGAEIRIPRLVMYIIKYISPVYLVGVFVAWTWQAAIKPPGEGKPSRLEQVLYFTRYDEGWKVPMALGFVLMVVVLFMLLVAQAQRRWRDHDTINTPDTPSREVNQ